MNVGINHFIFLSSVLFGLGLYVIITQKNMIRLYLGIATALLSPIISFAAFGSLHGFNPDSQIMILLILAFCIMLLVIGGIIFHNHYKESGLNELEN